MENRRGQCENVPGKYGRSKTSLYHACLNHKNLEKKGLLISRLVGNAYLYTPAMSEGDFKKNFMSGVVKNYFDNSYKELVNFFIQQKKLSPRELKELIDLIEGKK